MAPPVLDVAHLTKLYGAFRAVDNVSFSLERGKILGLLGPNGAGKTTTIQMLVGTTLPDGGQIRYFGQDLQRHGEACRQRINFCSSYNMLQGRITVWENLVVFAGLYGVRRPEHKIRELGEYFGITELMGQRFLTLSAGQKTRVNLVKALLNDPEIVLMDEPTASLDPDIADRTLSLIETLRDTRELAIVYTSHQMDEVTRICDEVIFLDRGRVVAHDTPAELTRRIVTAQVRVTFSGEQDVVAGALAQRYPDVAWPAHNVALVTTEEGRLAGAILDVAATGVTVVDVDIRKPTLEDVFLQIARAVPMPNGTAAVTAPAIADRSPGSTACAPSSPARSAAIEQTSAAASASAKAIAVAPEEGTGERPNARASSSQDSAVAAGGTEAGGRAGRGAVSLGRIWAVLQQEVFITARSVEVIVDLPFWSLMTVIVFGFVSLFLASVMDPIAAMYLYLGTLLWEIVRITQYSMSLGALWNVWSRNFNNMFIAPLSMGEYVLAQMLSGAAKAIVLFGLMSVTAALLFNFNLFQMGALNLSLIFLNLLWFAYSIGLFILGIILRLGTRIQALAWGLVLIFQPLTAAFYPLAVMPPALQAVALALPPTYVFEAARAGLADPAVQWTYMAVAALENALYFALSVAFFQYMYRRSRQTGQFARNEE